MGGCAGAGKETAGQVYKLDGKQHIKREGRGEE